MESAVDDPFADFSGPSQSPGVTSLLRHCIADDADFGEVQSDCVAGPGPFTAPGSEAAGCAFPYPSQQTATFHAHGFAQPSQLQLMQTESRAPAIGAFAAPGAPEYILGTEFSLGTSSPPTIPTTSGNAGTVAVGRRRGRKPKPQLPDLTLRLHGLNEQYKQLSRENIFLRDKLKVLERVVPYRDESVGFLTQLLSSAPAAAHAPGQILTQPDAAAAAGSTGPYALSPRARDQSPTASAGGAADSNSSGSGLSASMPGSSGEAQSSHAPADSGSTRGGTSGNGGGGRRCSSNAAAAGIAAFASLTASDIAAAGRGRVSSASSQQLQGQQQQRSSNTPTVLALCPSPDGEVPAITLAALEELKWITAQEFRMLWKHICLQLGVLVTGAEVHGPGSSPYVRLERFLERALSYMDKITLLSPACFVHSMYTNVETGQPERPSDNFWITCAHSLRLSEQQLREVTSLAAVYEQNVVPVVQQRLQLAMQLSTHLTAASAQQRGSSSSSASLTVLSSVDELAAQLERNVLKEHETHWNIGDFLCSSVLTPLQVAKALSVAYPYIPDGVAMLHAFKLISAQDDARVAAAQRAVAAYPSAPQLQAGTHPNPQPFPSLAGLLASQLPALAAGLVPGTGQAPRGLNATGAPQQLAGGGGGGAGQMATALAKLAAGLPPAQLQQALAAGLGLQQGQQLQSLLLAALQAARATTQPSSAAAAGPAATPVFGGMPAAAPATAQLQGLAALLGALAAAQQAVGAQSTAHARGSPPS